MSDPGSAGRIPETAFKVCLGVLLLLSITAVAARTIVRVRIFRQIHVDDFLLWFGLGCMCIATGLLYSMATLLYKEQAVIFDPERYHLSPDDMPKILRGFGVADAFVVFTWTAEFSMKMSLLFFFRRLVDRLSYLISYVRFVMVFTTLVWIIIIAELFIKCPHFGTAALKKCAVSDARLTISLTILTVVLDIFTDVMIISIPVCVIWKARISLRQKLGIGTFLTMNIWLIIIALVRVIFIRRGNNYDLTWTMFLQCLEPNIAILAASFSTFRSIFVANGNKARVQEERPSYSMRRRILRKAQQDRRPLDDLPTIPGPAFTGLSTIFGVSRSRRSDSSLNNRPIFNPASDGLAGDGVDSTFQIHVEKVWSLDSTRVTSSTDVVSRRQGQ